MMERVLEAELMDKLEDALDYDAMDHSEPNKAFVDRLVQLGAGGRMLDIGTGPGMIPLMVCDRVPDCTVLAVDLSEFMLQLAEQRRRQSPHKDRVSLRFGDAKELQFMDDAFDVVFSNTLMHHLADPRPFLREAWRVLRPGGAFLVRDLLRPETDEQLEALVEKHSVGANEHQKSLFRDSLRASLTEGELRDVLNELGFEGVEVTVDTDRHISIQKPATAHRSSGNQNGELRSESMVR